MANKILELIDVSKTFMLGQNQVDIIKGISFDVNEGDFIIIFGPSGCGKSTILNMLLGLESPTKGVINFLNKDIYVNDEDQRSVLRKKNVGMVYQQSNWIKALNVIENVYFPLTLRGIAEDERERKAWEMLKLVDMEQGAYQHPTELSSGQQQRVSLARALIVNPVLLVADEPTGNLDSKASKEIMELFKRFNQEGKTVVMVTHDLEYLSYATKSVNVADGLIAGQYKADDPRLKELSVSKRGAVPMEAKV
ncbi:MAG: transporter protein [Patescibacteria group bacterium]|jgi:putative ABC transport system ATP-binding protein|nr:transporter protein [Patescibacteria group bacterium]